MHATILVSRFRDSLTPGALPIVEEFDREFAPATTREPEIVSIHPHRLQVGEWLAVEWEFDAVLGDWVQQRRPVALPTLRDAIEFVPPGFEEIPGDDFATLVFKAVRS